MSPTDIIAAKFNFLSGQVQALSAFAMVIARTSAHPEIVLSEFEGAAQISLASAEMKLVKGDELVNGFQFVAALIRKALIESQANP